MYRISWPNRITLARILLVGPFVVALLHLQDWGEPARWGALAIFAVMAISDGLDGFLARRLNEESAVGRFLDPLADKILIFCSVILLANEGTHVTGALLPAWVAVVVVGKDLIIVLGFCIIYLGTARTYVEPQATGKWCTLLQLLMVIAVLLSPSLPKPLRLAPTVLWWCASAMALVTIVHYYRMGRQFIAQHEAATSADKPAPPE